MKKNSLYGSAGAFIALLMLLGACDKKDEHSGPAGQTTQLVLGTPLVDNDASTDGTKALVGPMQNTYFGRNRYNGSPSPNYHTLGIFVMKNSDPTHMQPHTSGYANMFARLDPQNDPTIVSSSTNMYYTLWRIPFPDGNEYSVIPLYTDRGNVDFYSYYPYNENVVDPKAIPFDMTAKEGTISAIYDHLYYAASNLNPTSSTDMAMTPMTYKHAMAWIAFNFNIVSGRIGQYTLNRINLSTVDGGAWIPVKGTYDATAVPMPVYPAMNVTESTDSLDFIYNRTFYAYVSGTTIYQVSYNYADILMPSIIVTPGATNRKLLITIYLNRDDAAPMESGSYTLDLDQLATATAGGGTRGLVAGYRYNFTITMDPSLRLLNFSLPNVTPWGDNTITVKI